MVLSDVTDESPALVNEAMLQPDTDLANLFVDADPTAYISYTDGEHEENAILEIVQSEPDTGPGSPGLSRHIKGWPTEYHFSPFRINLLRPVKHLLRGRVLEIGGGCGALSPYVAECAKDLVVVEGSLRRARICATRCRGRSNVAVWATNFSRVPISEKFDTVLLIGVLEYSPSFFDGEGRDPFDAVLTKARDHLAPGGRVIIAIENRLGLKYFCGAPEDHAMTQFFGIEDRYGTDRFKTFGRRELLRILDRNGLGHTDLYLAFPDYKLPKVVLHQSAFDDPDIDLESLLLRVPTGNRGRKYRRLVAEQFVWPVLMNNGLAADLANSFLMIAAPEPMPAPTPASTPQDLAFHYSIRDKRGYSKETVIFRDEGGDLKVRRASLFDREADGQGIVWSPKDEPFYKGRGYIGGLLDLAKKPRCDIAAIADWCRPWLDFLDAHAVASEDGPILPEDFIDCIPLNLVHNGRSVQFYDREWVLRTKPLRAHVVFRGVHWALSTIASLVYWDEARRWKILDLTRLVLARVLPKLGAEDVNRLIDDEVALQAMIGQDPVKTRTLISTQCFDPRTEVQQEIERLSAAVRTEQQRADEMHALSAQLGAVLAHDLPALRVKGFVDSVAYDEAGHLVVVGWAFDQALMRPPQYVVLRVEDRVLASAPLGITRNDVYQALGAPDCTKLLGFRMVVPSKQKLTVNYQNSKILAFSPEYIGELQWSRAFFRSQSDRDDGQT